MATKIPKPLHHSTTDGKSNGICLGTRMVVLTSDDPNDPKEGLLVLYDSPSRRTVTGNNKDELLVQVGTAGTVFQTAIDISKQVKVPPKERTIETVSNFLLQDNEDRRRRRQQQRHDADDQIVVSFQFVSSINERNREELKLTIQQRILPSGIMKFVFQGILLASKNDLLAFCASLGNAINEGQQTVSKLSTELKSAQKGVLNWKATAQSMDQTVWQQEKQKILEKMTSMWQENQKRCRERISELENKLKLISANNNNKNNSHTTNNGTEVANKLPSTLLHLNAPDDDDEKGLFQEEMAQRLAAGKRTAPKTLPKQLIHPSEMINKSVLEKQQRDYQQKVRQKKRKENNAERRKKNPPPPPPPTTTTLNEEQEERIQKPPAKRKPHFSSPSSSPEELKTRPSPHHGKNNVREDVSISSNSSDDDFRKAIFASVQQNRVVNDDKDDDEDTDISF